ncbi:multi-sensor hybrid histidine kinase [Calothrix sp. NIES-4071]|nr:multi-sensor hybrid histidine kinase [Calothrix sp. NIES-4071]BAZ61355.1 multi-sensor hybrid histidine kinase [Calothrix sp. NIES-4105]
MKLLLNKKIITAFTTALASFGFSGWLLYQIPEKQNAANYWVKHTNKVLTELETTLSVMKDAETGQRGYLLTGDKSYLEPYNQATAKIDRYIEQLQELTRDNANQQRRIAILKPLITAKLSELKQTIEVRQKLGFNAASPIVLSGKGKRNMNEIRQMITEMQREEKNLLNRRTQQEEATSKATRKTFLMLICLDIGLVCLIYYLVANDICKRAEMELALRQTQARFSSAVNNAPFPLMIHASDGAVEKINTTWQELTGYTQAEISTIADWTEKAFGQRKELVRKDIDKLYKLNEKIHSGEYLISTKSGEERIWDFSSAPLGLTPDGRKLVLSTAVDVTERVRLETERKQLLESAEVARSEAEAANRVKDQFIAVLSHELRSPLNPILGWTNLLKSRKFDEATTNKALNTIERNVKLQIQLIDDLLDISRILRGKISLHETTVDLSFVIDAAVETVRYSTEAKSIQIQTQFNTNEALVKGDVNRLQQVVVNLLTNAVKFTPNEGQVEVSLSIFNPQFSTPCAQIQVRDTGKGINPEFLPYVFEHFRQADSSTTRNFGGLGLGLAIVRHLVELHGGTVTAQSQGEGHGATFTVNLPLISPAYNVPSNLQPQSEPSLEGIKILIVDDESDTRELLAFVLEQYGANVTVAASASDALNIFQQCQPNILLSDLGMPLMDGYSLIRQIRTIAAEQGGQIPAIALTAFATDVDKQQVLAAGFNNHIAKPVEPIELVTLVAQLAPVVRFPTS